MVNHFNPAEVDGRSLLAWTIRVLREHGIKPRKRLSQNFVVDPSLIREILSHVDPGERVLEVGCGIGTLSKAILEKAHTLLCIELDHRLCEVAEEVVDEHRFVIVNGDARELPYAQRTVVSNLPYHVTSDILVKISKENSVTKAVLTVQKEVAERLLARPGSKSYGRLTVLVGTLFRVEKGGTYPPRSFYPRPQVYHQVVVLTRRSNYTSEVGALEKLTRIFFSQRRRLVEKILAEALGVRAEELGHLKYRIAGKRVSTIDPELWFELSRTLAERGVL
ncbi:MAG: 16S rRNA (adenine(1518)-N(6)/adenine(1519)-N(6))-dimethyltransferase RsmA [Desulfurococcaceae archaeon]